MYKTISCTLWPQYIVSQRTTTATATLLGKAIPSITRRSLLCRSYSAFATPVCFQEHQSSSSSLSLPLLQSEGNTRNRFIENNGTNKLAPEVKYKQRKQTKKAAIIRTEAVQSSEKEYKEWRNALEERDPIKVWEVMQPFMMNHTLAKTPVKLMEATFRLMHTRGTSIQYNVIQDSALDDREQPLFDCFLDALFKYKVQLFKWELIALWMQRERERARPLRILIINHRVTHRILSNRTAIRGVALEETIMAASQIDPRLMELLESDNTTNEQHIAMNDTDTNTNMDMTLSMKHPARNMPILRNMILCALSPAIRLSSNAWCSLLEWTAFRTPPMLTRLLEKAYRDGFVLSGALGERLLVGSTLREPYSLPVIYQLYEATIKAEGRPDQRSVSRLLHLLLQSSPSNGKSKWTPEEKLKIAYDVFRQELATGRLPHASANRLLISRLVSHHRYFEAKYVYNECRSTDQGHGRQSLIYSAMIQSYIARRQLSEARQLVNSMFKDTLRRQINSSSSSPLGYDITGPQGEPVALRLHNENEIELYNSSVEKTIAKDRVVVCTLWPHAQTAGVLIDAYGRCGDERHYKMAEQLYNEVTTQWGIYHEFLTAPMMRVYLTWGQPERALSIADEALERGAQADVWMVSAQIQGLAALTRLEEAETKLDAFITKKTTTTATTTSVHVLQRLYHALALGHAQQGNLDQVRRIYAKMRANLKLSVPLPDSWTAHMIAAAHRNSISDVCAVKQELEEDGYLLGDQNYAIALLVFAKQGNLMLAQQWFDQIVASEKNEHKEKQITMTRHIITAMLQAYTRSDHSDKGYLFWCDMRAKYSNDINSPTRIDNALLSVLLDMSGRGLGVKETETIWHMATTSDRVRVNGNNGAALVEAYMRHGELEKAVNTMEQYRNDPAMRGMGVMQLALITVNVCSY